MKKTSISLAIALAVLSSAASAQLISGGTTHNGGTGGQGGGGGQGGAGGAGLGVGVGVGVGVGQGGSATATGGNAAATGGNSSSTSGVIGSGNSASNSGVANSGNSTNSLSNAATGGAGGAGGAANSASNSNATSNSGGNTMVGGSQATTNNNGSAANVTVQGDTVTYEAQARNPVSTAYAAPLTASNGTCMGSTSAGAQGVGFGVSFGSTWTDTSCDMRYDAQALTAAGLRGAAQARLCQKPEIAQAMAAAGTPCPGAKNAAAADLMGPPVPVALAQADAPAQPQYTDPIIRARLGLPPLK